VNNELKKTLSIKIKRLDMFPNHFFGVAEINKEEYKINIQGQSMLREKLIKLPIKFEDEKALFTQMLFNRIKFFFHCDMLVSS